MIKPTNKDLRRFAAKVQPIYELLDWKWSTTDCHNRVPTVDDIYKTLQYLLGGLERKPSVIRSETGGLFVELDSGSYGEEDCVEFGFKVSELPSDC